MADLVDSIIRCSGATLFLAHIDPKIFSLYFMWGGLVALVASILDSIYGWNTLLFLMAGGCVLFVAAGILPFFSAPFAKAILKTKSSVNTAKYNLYYLIFAGLSGLGIVAIAL